MRWNKLGIVWRPDNIITPNISHAIAPTPFKISDEIIRIYFTSMDEEGRGRPYFADVKANNPLEVLKVSSEPLIELGEPGTFDENGVMPLSIVPLSSKKLFMYYSGFELSRSIRYRIFTGLAISHDGGDTFSRFSRAPILDRSDTELYFRGGAFCAKEENKFKLWYVAGSSWTTVNDRLLPVYDLRYQESNDGIRWSDKGQLSMPIRQDSDEHGFGRPWVIKRGPADYQLFYSIRRCSLGGYRLGYAESKDGIQWIRKDNDIGLDVTTSAFDSNAIMYSAVFNLQNRTYCFYNGNNFGENGFAVAELLT